MYKPESSKKEAKKDSQSGYYREIGVYMRSCHGCQVMQLFQEKDS